MIDIKELNNFKEVFEKLEKTSDNYVIAKYMQGKEVCTVYKEEFWNDVKTVSLTLTDLQLQGKHVGIMGKNSYEWVICFCAILNIGSVAVPFNKDYMKGEIEELSELADLSAMIFDAERETLVTEALSDSQVLRISMDPSSSGKVISLKNKREEKGITITNVSGREDLASIIFTSGTTGKNKAVMLSNKALMLIFSFDSLSDNSSTLEVLPFHHMAGFSGAINTICVGKCLAIGESPKRIIQYLSSMKAEYVSVVPALMSVLEKRLRKAKRGEKPLGDLKYISCGGAKFLPETLHTFLEWGIEIWQAYAASETGGIGFFYKMDMENKCTLGKPSALIEADIEDGELVLRGDSIMMGYYKDEDATNEVIKDGWYHTGDLFRVDEDGNYYYVGRKKNLIILSNGENISPEEIENRLQVCEDICEVLIKEDDDFICGEIYPDYPDRAAEEEKERIRDRISLFVENYNRCVPTYKQVKIVRFREAAFEKTAIGKIVRNQ